MRRRLAGLLLFAGSAMAQEGFPLDGTWRAERVAADGGHRTIVLLMDWDGQRINGVIDPGPEATRFTSAALDPARWTVTFEATNGRGQPIAFEGTLAELGKYNRKLTGKWTEGGQAFDLRFVRE